MILLAHMFFGAAVGSLTNNVFLGVLLALLSHYFLDLFPHVEYLDGVENSIASIRESRWKKNAIKIFEVFLDFALGLALIFWFSQNQPIFYLYALVAIIPDGLTVVHSLFPRLGLALHHKIHSGPIHYLTKQKKFPIFWKILTQVAAVMAAIFIFKN